MLLKYFKKNSIIIVIITSYMQIIAITMHYNEIRFLLMLGHKLCLIHLDLVATEYFGHG